MSVAKGQGRSRVLGALVQAFWSLAGLALIAASLFVRLDGEIETRWILGGMICFVMAELKAIRVELEKWRRL